jgi:hypothetical protein
VIFWTKPPRGDHFRISFALDYSLGRHAIHFTRRAIGHLHFSCIWHHADRIQEEGRSMFAHQVPPLSPDVYA